MMDRSVGAKRGSAGKERRTSQRKAALRAAKALRSVSSPQKITLVIAEANKAALRVDVPAMALPGMRQVFEQIAGEPGAAAAQQPAELTTQQAADLLGVSRPFVVKLLQQNKLRYRKVGAHRRLLLADVERYRAATIVQRTGTLDELSAASQDMGLYDL